MLCRNFNCTPSEAIHELRHQPYIWDIILAEQYRHAYEAVEAWHAMTAEQRQNATAPAGPMVRRVELNRRRWLESQFEEREEALEREGRA